MRRNVICLVAGLLIALSGRVAARAQTTAPAEVRPAPAEILGEKWVFSGDGGKSWSVRPPAVAGGKVGVIVARTSFSVPEPSASAFWALRHALPPRLVVRFRLDGEEVPLPLKRMYYRTIPAIPAKLLKKGGNELTGTIRIDNRPPRDDRRRVMPPVVLPPPKEPPALAAQRLAFQTGPILGAFDNDYFTVTCRTNVPAPVELTVRPAKPAGGGAARPTKLTSPAGLFHRFHVPRKPAESVFTYQLRAAAAGRTVETEARTVRLPAFAGEGQAQPVLRFVIMGDSRTRTREWASVAAAVLAEKPDFVVFTGDMCTRGTNDWEWDDHYLAPAAAKELLATVPLYAVKGNHEEDAAAYRELFYTPSPDGRDEHWAQHVGPPPAEGRPRRPWLLLIGINGQWSPRWKRTHAWIEETLAGSKAKFVFLASHYPAYSSGGNGKLDPKTGQPTHWAYVAGRSAIVPMLVKHKATALLVAHEHHYERSELPGGLPQIISGGAGAPLSGRSREAARQNPYAKVFAQTLNYCLFEIKGETCTLTAKTPGGKVIETLTWTARKLE